MRVSMARDDETSITGKAMSDRRCHRDARRRTAGSDGLAALPVEHIDSKMCHVVQSCVSNRHTAGKCILLPERKNDHERLEF